MSEEFQIYNEDCLEGMKRLADNSVDMIATDPPYCVGASSNGVKSSFADLNLMRPFWDQCFAEYRRSLKSGGHVYLCTDWRTYPFLYPLMIKYLVVRNLIVWNYGWMKAGNFYRHMHELIIFGTKGESRREFSCKESDVWQVRCVNYTKDRNHPAEKPVELMERMIKNSSTKGGIVLDSFMGSGSTGVAAINTGRKFIGFELEEKFYKIAQERITKAIAQKEQALF